MLTVAAPTFWRSVNRVRPAVSHDPKSPILHNVLIEYGDTRLRLVATDRLRLAVSDLTVTGEHAQFAALVPMPWLASLDLNDHAGPIGISADDQSVRIIVGEKEHVTAKVTGDFPDYHPFLVSTAGLETLIVDRVRLIDAIEQLDDGGPLQLTIAEGALEVGQADPIVISTTYTGRPLSLFVNPVFVRDAAALFAGEQLAIDVAGPLRPISVRDPDDDSHVTIIMPIRVSQPRRRARRQPSG